MNYPVNNLLVQEGGVLQDGLLVAHGTSPVKQATAMDISGGLDLLGSTEGSVPYRDSSAWGTRLLQPQMLRISSLRA